MTFIQALTLCILAGLFAMLHASHLQVQSPYRRDKSLTVPLPATPRLISERDRRIVRLDIAVMLLSAGLILSFTALYLLAVAHGLHANDAKLYDMAVGVCRSPMEDDLPEDLNGAIIIYYRFGCKDCQAVHAELDAAVKTCDRVYYVDSRSPQGKELLKAYPTPEVPSGVYITTQDDPYYIQYKLYATDGSGSTVFLRDAFERLLELQAQER